jgi:hypothetical protein
MKEYKGKCHCGNVEFTAQADLTELIVCNCSHCDIKGFLMAFVPEENIKISGEEHLSEYRFNKKSIAHKFCKSCGVQPIGTGEHDGKVSYMVNARCINDEEVRTLPIKHVDGKNM